MLSLEQFLRERGGEFELIYLTRYTVAAQALPLIRRHAPQARLLFCNADLHHLRQLRAARAEGLEGEEAQRALEAVEEVKRQELEVMRQVDLTLSYSEVERAVIEAETLGEAATAPCPWVVEGPGAPRPPRGPQRPRLPRQLRPSPQPRRGGGLPRRGVARAAASDGPACGCTSTAAAWPPSWPHAGAPCPA